MTLDIIRKWGSFLSLATILLGLSLEASIPARAERLPIKVFTTADGLGHNNTHRIVRDSHGFLWFCTREGLSRFDGYSFTNYGIEHGLPSAIVNDFIETREGEYWVATAGGLCRFNPLGKSRARVTRANENDATTATMFTVYLPGSDARSNHILSLLRDRSGHIWCGTRNGLFRVEGTDGRLNLKSIELGIPDYLESRSVLCLLEDRLGALWIGTAGGLFRRLQDGQVETFMTSVGIHSLLQDREGRIWVGTQLGGLYRLVNDPISTGTVIARAYSEKDGLPTRWINQLYQATDGTLWAGSDRGLLQFVPTPDGRDYRFRAYTEAHGLGSAEVAAITEDGNGNLWVGTINGGAAKLSRSGFTTFGEADGFASASSIIETRAGDLVVVGALRKNDSAIYRFDGEKFSRISLSIATASIGFSWGWNQTLLEDRTGEWWMATRGLTRYPRVSNPEQLARTSPKARYTTRDGLPADMILRLFEDSHGNVWIGSVAEGLGSNGLSRWERGTRTLSNYTEKDRLPHLDVFYVSSFAEDLRGNLWIGFSREGGLVRYRDGTFTSFTASDGVPSGTIRNLFVDSVGRLWVATYQSGLGRIDDPAADRPRFVTMTTGNGLSSNEVTTVSEDRWGRIYVGTARGIDRLDTKTDRVKHYTTADGLPRGEIRASLRDRNGDLWFSFATGLVRFIPQPDPPPVPPPILLTGLRIAGESHSLSALGEVEVAPIELGRDKNHLQIDFVGLAFGMGEGLRYQYRLEGSNEDWSRLSEQRTVTFANLAPGKYRFLVRAVNAEGTTSERPAGFSFRVLPPLWQRWWFLMIVALTVGLAAYALYRYRLQRLLELERVRTRIAADLHDDIGANLTKIGILSEVVCQQVNGADRQTRDTLSSIASLSRESVATMSDIIWAINPRRDTLRDLTRRMREFAGEMLASRDIEFEFRAPASEVYLKLGADVRRTVFLVFKEAVNNVVRHSACSKAEIDLRLEGASLVLSVRDNGKGLDVTRESEGNGLASMKSRGASMGGKVEIGQWNASGTSVVLRLPIKPVTPTHARRSTKTGP